VSWGSGRTRRGVASAVQSSGERAGRLKGAGKSTTVVAYKGRRRLLLSLGCFAIDFDLGTRYGSRSQPGLHGAGTSRKVEMDWRGK
jgi:hypothetical protein